MTWQQRAACRDLGTDLFYPEKGVNQSAIRAAKAVCGGCPVTAECLQYALANDDRFGIWGGKSERERRKLRRRREAA